MCTHIIRHSHAVNRVIICSGYQSHTRIYWYTRRIETSAFSQKNYFFTCIYKKDLAIYDGQELALVKNRRLHHIQLTDLYYLYNNKVTIKALYTIIYQIYTMNWISYSANNAAIRWFRFVGFTWFS